MSTPGTRTLVGKLLVKVRDRKASGSTQTDTRAAQSGFADRLSAFTSEAKAALALVGKDAVKESLLLADEASKLAKSGKTAIAFDKLETAQALLSTHRDAASQAEYPQLLQRLAKRFQAMAAVDAAQLPQEPRDAFEARRADIGELRRRAQEKFEGGKFSEALSLLGEAGELATEAIGALPKRAGFAATLEQKLQDGIQLPDSYRGEETKGVKYYDDKERRVTADYIDPTGRIRDAEGQLKDTRTIKDDTGAVLKQGRDMYVKDHQRGTTHSFQEEKGRDGGELEHHSSAPAGGKVDAAGRRVVEGGILRRIDGDSGHYKPKTENIHKYLQEQIDIGVRMIDDESLTMRGQDGKDVPAGPEAAALYKVWKTYDDAYHDQRRLALSSGEATPLDYDKANPYASDMQSLRQRLQDMGVAPRMSDATVEALKAKNWNTQPEFDAVASDPDKEAKLMQMLAAKIGPKAYRRGIKGNQLGEAAITDSVVKNAMLKWAGASSWDRVTLDDWNRAIGVFLRLHWDVPYAAGAKSEARVEMPAAQFAQTGGNVAAIEAKAQAGAFVRDALARRVPIDKKQAQGMLAEASADQAELAALARQAQEARSKIKSPEEELQERFDAAGGDEALHDVEQDWGVPLYAVSNAGMSLAEQVDILEGRIGKSQFEARLKLPDEFTRLGGRSALQAKEQAWGLALYELSNLDLEDRIAVLEDRLSKADALARLAPEPVVAEEHPAQKKYQALLESKLVKLGGVARLKELGVADADALSPQAQLERFRELAHTAVAQDLVLADADTKESESERLERLYRQLKGDEILKGLGVDPAAFSIEQRFEIACKKRVPPQHLVQAYGVDAAYERLGGDASLKAQLGVVDAASFSVDERLDMLSRGYVPADRMIQAFGDIALAIAKLGGDARLKELGAPYPANLSDVQKFEILSSRTIPPKYLMDANGGPAGVEAQIKELLRARGLEIDLVSAIPLNERLRLVLSKHLGDFTAELERAAKKLKKYNALGGPTAMRSTVEAKLEALGLPRSMVSSLDLDDMKDWIEDDDDIPAAIEKAAKERAAELEVAAIGTSDIRNEVEPLLLSAGLQSSDFDKMSAQQRLEIYRSKSLSAGTILELKGGLTAQQVKQKAESISVRLKSKDAADWYFDGLSTDLKLKLILGTATENDLSNELSWAFR